MYISLLAPLFDMIMVSSYYDISTTVLLVVLVELVVVVGFSFVCSLVRKSHEKHNIHDTVQHVTRLNMSHDPTGIESVSLSFCDFGSRSNTQEPRI